LSKINFYKYIFHSGVFVLIILSIYPGNLIGLILWGDDTTFPGSDKLHHFLSYLVVSILGFLAYREKIFFNRLYFFLFFLAFILELLQIWIPNRYFELLDMFCNFSGVMIALGINKLLLYQNKNDII
jgi:VanZ family protein